MSVGAVSKKTAKAAVILTAMIIVAWVVLKPTPGVTEKKDPGLAKLGLGDFIATEITYDGVMHEIYWHYELANHTILEKKFNETDAHLRILNFYINILPFLQRDSEFFKTPDSIRKFDAYAINLLESVDSLRGKLGKDDATVVGKKMEKNTTAMCKHCHDDLKKIRIREITPFGEKIDIEGGMTGFITEEITYDGVMHEIYWHYEFANQMLRLNRTDDAKAHLMVMIYYVDMLPGLQRDEEFFNKPDDVKNFDEYAKKLKSALKTSYGNIGKKSIDDVGKQMESSVSRMCHHCHDRLRDKAPIREITPYGNKITLGKSR